jgi:hypothetical protein
MKVQHSRIRKSAAIVTAWCFFLSGEPFLGQTTSQTAPKPTAPAQAAPKATAPTQTAPAQPAPTAAAPPPPPVDGGWPRAYITPSAASLILYQPQIASWVDQKTLVLFSAVAYTPKNGKRALGTVKATADTQIATEERLVNYSAVKVDEANFPTLDKPQVQEIVTQISSTIPSTDGVIALDRVLSGLDKSQIIPKNVEGVKADPPTIYFSKTPALLVNIDGEPVWGPIMGTDLRYAINTNWDLFENTATKTFYLRNNETWLRTSTLDGGWVPAGKLPESFSKLPMDENWKDVKAAVPGKQISTKDVPRVFLTREPAEMILLKGEPNYVSVTGTNLLWVSNTESDVFRDGMKGQVYYLVTGRWFSAPDFTGPWTFASTNLPQDFAKIPLEHARSRVLASVPGTTQAAEAVLLAQVPETARVSKALMAPQVSYQGMPQFEKIDPTKVERAVNTDKDILKVGDLYYMCFQGVWFVSRTPDGPWEVTGKVPKEIYEIPPSSSSHNVTYVTVEDDNDDAVVFATVAAYTGMMVAWGCAVWGTGYYYPPYVGYGGMYPVYYPRYPTYGYSAWYNPWNGAYGRGMSVYGPYGGAGVGARYNPTTGTYARGAAAYGPYGSRAAATAYNPRTGAVGATRQGSNVYGSWGTTSVARGDQWATTSRVTNNRTGTTTRVTQTDQGGAISRTGPQGSGAIGTNSQGDVYAGRDGNVYRKQEGGGWQQYNNGGWNNVEPTPEQRQQAQDRATQAQDRASQARSQAGSQTGAVSDRATEARSQTGTQAGSLSNRPSSLDSSTMGQLNRDNAARVEGAQRTRDYNTVRSSGGSGGSYNSSRSGSYRPSGGRSMGGGGRRR